MKDKTRNGHLGRLCVHMCVKKGNT